VKPTSETFLGRLSGGIQEFWAEWNSLIVTGVIVLSGLYLLTRWLIWKLPDFFLEREPEE
jgi:hypothetical protein